MSVKKVFAASFTDKFKDYEEKGILKCPGEFFRAPHLYPVIHLSDVYVGYFHVSILSDYFQVHFVLVHTISTMCTMSSFRSVDIFVI